MYQTRRRNPLVHRGFKPLMRQSQQKSSAEMFKKPLWQTLWTQIRLLLYEQMANSVDPDIGAVCSGTTLFASILNSSVMLGNYLQQTTFSDAFFSWRFKG